MSQSERDTLTAAKQWLSDNMNDYVTYGPLQFAAMAFVDGADWQAAKASAATSRPTTR